MFKARAAVWEWLAAEAQGHVSYPYSHPHQALRFDSSDHMVREVNRSGSYYFSPDTMRAFKSRTHELISNRFLITSEKDSDHPRLYRVVYATQPTGKEAPRISMERSPFLATLSQARGFTRELCKVLTLWPNHDDLQKAVAVMVAKDAV